jgi:hypothetical protein
MGFLYLNRKGEPHRRHSYSAGNLFDQSPFSYYLQKIQGWKQRDNKASFLFGRALEESIQFYHDNNGNGPATLADFKNRWDTHKETPDLRYTKAEKDWVNLSLIGIEMLKLYIIRQPGLPIPLGGQSVFQREYAKEVFPGDPVYGDIEDVGKLDVVCYVEPAHPMLAKLEWRPEYGMLRPLIVDIKTAAVDFPENPGMAAFDLQLRRYSCLSGIRDVSLLWFKKTSRNIQKGSSVTLLVDSGDFRAGDEGVVARIEKSIVPTENTATVEHEVWIVRNDFMLEEMAKAQGVKEDGKTEQTKVAKERAFEWLKNNGTPVAEHEITKQRLQFNSGFVTLESANEAGQIAARQIVQIVNAWKQYKDSKPWPSTFGIRYPKDDRNDPYFRAFVLKDEGFKKDYFKKSDDETLDDLFQEPEEAEIE